MLAQLLVLLALGYASSEKNVVTQWNEVLGMAVKNSKMYPPETTRLYALTHLAMRRAHDLVRLNPVDQNCPDRDNLVISVAAHYVIGGSLPQARGLTDAMLRSFWLDARCSRGALDFYNQLAVETAMQTLAERAKDNCNCFHHYRPAGDYNDWLPTNPNEKYPILPCWGNTTLFAGVMNPLRFMPPGPPSPETEQFQNDWQEVFVMGKKISSLRSRELTESAILWDPPIFVAFLNKIVADVLAQNPKSARSTRAHLDLFYLANAAGANAAIITWKAKYIWSLWRPVHSNRVGIAQFPQIPTDVRWDSLLPTPPFPEYTSGHSAIGSGMLVVLRELLGDQYTFVVTDGVYSHHYNSISAAIEANEVSRYNGGVHWRFSGEHSADIGRQLAYEVLKLNPVEGFPWNGPNSVTIQ